jgi:hypothetical protein
MPAAGSASAAPLAYAALMSMQTWRTSAGPRLGLEARGEAQHRLVVAPLGGEQQPLGIQVAHDSDEVLATAQAGLSPRARATRSTILVMTSGSA